MQHVDDGEDLAAVDRALAAARAEAGRPSLIMLRTIIGWPAPNKQNTGAAHGSALGEDAVRAWDAVAGTIRIADWSGHQPGTSVSASVVASHTSAGSRCAAR